MSDARNCKSGILRNARAAFAALTFLCATASVSSAFAAVQSSHLKVSQNEVGATQHVEVSQNKSVIIDLPVDVREVIVSQPTVATAIMRSKQRAIVQGVGVGETNIFFLDERGERIAVLEISVTSDASGLESAIARVVPGSRIRVETFGERVVLSGTAISDGDVKKALSIAAQFAQSPDNVANVITINGPQQVALKVTVAEVARETVKQLGIDLSASFNSSGITGSVISLPGIGGASSVLTNNSATLGVSAGAFQLEATLRALERQGVLRTLAEPTLTAISGQEAHFLAGGEFPIPSGFDNGAVTIEFKKFGVDLTFTPTVMSDGMVGLVVNTRVSELSSEGGFVLGPVTIPATREREASTSVQLKSGSTLAIAGLIEDKARQQMNKLPGIGDLPVLGALFRSRDFVRAETELLVLVTPVIAQVGAPPGLPTDDVVITGDAEAIFLGRMQKLYGVGGGKAEGKYHGSVGFVLD